MHSDSLETQNQGGEIGTVYSALLSYFYSIALFLYEENFSVTKVL